MCKVKTALSEAYKTQLLEDVFNAYFRARRHKRNTMSQLAYEMNVEANLMVLYYQLLEGNYEPAPSFCFIVNHPVKREVFASQFRDRIVHRLLFDYIEPIFERRFIFDSYSCRINKGTSAGIKRIGHHIRSCTQNYTRGAWVLKLDLKGYFMSINKEIAYRIISCVLEKHWGATGINKVQPAGLPDSDAEFIDYLLRTIIFKDPTKDVVIRSKPCEWDGLPASKSLLKSRTGNGLPIGDLTSQLFSNIYMDVFDNYVKRELHIEHYGRYVDDFFVVHESKAYLLELIGKFRRYLLEKFGLTLHPDKIYLQDCRKGVSYLGAFIKPYRNHPIRRSVGQFRRKLKEAEALLCGKDVSCEILNKVRATLNSYLGYLGAFKSRRIMRESMIGSPVLKYFTYIPAENKITILSKYRKQVI